MLVLTSGKSQTPFSNIWTVDGVRMTLTGSLHVKTEKPNDIILFMDTGSEAVDCFTQDWGSCYNWLVPPICIRRQFGIFYIAMRTPP